MNQQIRKRMNPKIPFEKCYQKSGHMKNVNALGAGSLTDIELLAVLLRTGTKGECTGSCQEAFYPGEGTQPQAKSPSSKLDKRRTAEN